MTGLEFLALLLGIIGILGAIIPGLPGPPLSWIGLLIAYIGGGDGSTITSTALFVWLGVVTVITVLDYIIPSAMTKAAGGHKAAAVGAMIGLFAGILLTPIGMIAGSLLGAFIGEFVFEDKTAWSAFKASLGAFAGFMLSTFAKLVVSGILLWKIGASVIA